MMLTVWNLSPSQADNWPLRVKHSIIVLFTRIGLTRFAMDGKTSNEYASIAIKSFLLSLKRAVLEGDMTCKCFKCVILHLITISR